MVAFVLIMKSSLKAGFFVEQENLTSRDACLNMAAIRYTLKVTSGNHRRKEGISTKERLRAKD